MSGSPSRFGLTSDQMSYRQVSPHPTLVFDGDCAFCARSVDFILKRDKKKRTLRFAARTGTAGSDVRVRHPQLADVESMVWVESVDGSERTLTHSSAVLAVMRYLGGIWGALAAIGSLVPRLLRDVVYNVIARVRKKLSGGREVCIVPPAEDRHRFLR